MSTLLEHLRSVPRNEKIIAAIGFIAGIAFIVTGAWRLL